MCRPCSLGAGDQVKTPEELFISAPTTVVPAYPSVTVNDGVINPGAVAVNVTVLPLTTV